MIEKKQQEEEAMALRDINGNDVFKIATNGDVYWFNPELGDLCKAHTDADLGKAMSLAILQVAGMDYHQLLGVYLGESIEKFKKALIAKISEGDAKIKSLKKIDLINIISDFK